MDFRYLLLFPVFMASIFWLSAAVCVLIFMRRSLSVPAHPFFPFVTILKPVCGLERDLVENLQTACYQDYPEYEVIFGIQRADDPALGCVKKIVSTSAGGNARIIVDESAIGNNGKINNLYNASKTARGEVFVISDSDIRLAPDYLVHIVAPLADPRIGISCTLYQAQSPKNIYEALELLSYNSDFVISILFATVTGIAIACPGATLAIRREVLDAVGGFASLADYLVEDYELGRRVVKAGYKIRFIPYTVKMSLDLNSFSDWWRHQVGWDQKTKSASPLGFFFTLIIRGVPFALLYVATHAPSGWIVFLSTIGIRIGTAIVNAINLHDVETIKYIWLLPVRDLLSLFVWLASLVKQRITWRGRTFVLKKGKMKEVLG